MLALVLVLALVRYPRDSPRDAVPLELGQELERQDKLKLCLCSAGLMAKMTTLTLG